MINAAVVPHLKGNEMRERETLQNRPLGDTETLIRARYTASDTARRVAFNARFNSGLGCIVWAYSLDHARELAPAYCMAGETVERITLSNS